MRLQRGPGAVAARAGRKLGAILAAQLVGDGPLAGRDEAGTMARLHQLRRELLEPLIAKHRGRAVELTAGDVLGMFAGAVDAVGCAVAVQKGVAAREADVAAADRIRYRVGVNLGYDVERDDLTGAEADDAARLATLAAPGDICIARAVYDEVKTELKLPYEHHGDWMRIALMSTNTPDAWPRTMDLIEVSAVRISVAAITGESGDAEPSGFLRRIKRFLNRRSH